MNKRAMWVLALLMVAGAAQSKVVIHGTRVIYPAQDREVIVRMSNLATDEPSLMQVWLDAGDASSTPDTIEVPFVVTAPVFRIEPNGGQSLRLSYTGEPLPTDRESLFWMNVLEIPPKVQDAETQGPLMQFSYRTRLKTFFRPRGLEAIDAQKATEQLRWSLSASTLGIPPRLKVNNPTPFHVSLSGVDIVDGERRVPAKRGDRPEENLLRPFSSLEIALTAAPGAMGPAPQVEFTAVGDYGNRYKTLLPLLPAGN